MSRYLMQRLIQLVPVLLGVSLIAFSILHLAPGDPVSLMLPGDASREQIDELRHRLGFDQPLPVQYFRWLGAALTGDLGKSLFSSRPVMVEVLERFPATALLTFGAFLIALTGGLLLGVAAAVKQGTKLDSSAMVLSVAGWSMPPFWIGLILIILFSVQLKWLPTGGMFSATAMDNSLADLAWHLVLPAFTLGLRHMAYVARLTRSSMLEVLSEDYVRTARAKGLKEHTVIYGHALRNALIPVLTVAGVSLGQLLGGAVVVEAVFSWPGVGSLMLKGILARDFPLVQGGMVFVASVFVMVNLAVDLLYAAIDPRIRYT